MNQPNHPAASETADSGPALLAQTVSRVFNNTVGGYLTRARDTATSAVLNLPPATHRYDVVAAQPIVMPDGVTLVHDHYRPHSYKPLPAVLIRTPYGRSGTLPGFAKQWVAARMAERGYHVIVQDTRGRGASSGEFEPYVHEAGDGRATLDWVAAQAWCDGAIGMYGQSYVGFATWAAAASQHPNLRAIVPIITQSRLGGVPEHSYPLDLTLRWLLLLDGMSNPDVSWAEAALRGVSVDVQDRLLAPGFNHLPLGSADVAVLGKPSPIFRRWMRHARAEDPYWQQSDFRAAVADAPPGQFIAGWYDLFIQGQLRDFAVQQAAGRQPRLIVGPWTHLDMHNQFGTLGASLRWLDQHLKGALPPAEPPVRLFVMGANRWRDYASWPPPASDTPFYLQGDGSRGGALHRLPAPPTNDPSRYTYDPADPTPNVGGLLLSTRAGAADNRALEARPDVLTFTTETLAAPVEAIGPVTVTLYVATSTASADFFARLCDVRPDGRSLNICDGIFRLGDGHGEAQPDGSTRITLELTPTAYRWKAGHRIRLQVSSGAHPRYARNLGTRDHYMFGSRTVVAQQTIYHDATHPSALHLPLMAID